MERRVPPADREFPSGVTLTTSTMGGYSVHRSGDYLGYIHASVAPLWNAYLRRVGQADRYLGKLRQDEAVQAIVDAWNAALPALNRMP